VNAQFPIRHVGVVIPARNEEDHIQFALASINAARAALPDSVTSSCVVVVDGCTDRTSERSLQRIGTAPPPAVVKTSFRRVGAARAAGARWVLANTHQTPGEVWLANTDADSTVMADWLTQQIALAELGAAAVAGIVQLDRASDLSLLARFAASYRVEPDGTHTHVHGANLGVRADAYLEVGGWRDLATAEDHDLWNRLAHRYSRVSSTAVVVTTSGRIVGRAPSGFAGDMFKHAVAARSVA